MTTPRNLPPPRNEGSRSWLQVLVFIVLFVIVFGLLMTLRPATPAQVVVTLTPFPSPTTATEEPTAEATEGATAEATAAAAEATGEATTAASSQRVFFAEGIDGETVPATFTVEFAAEGLTVEPAGEAHEGAGHFHIIVDDDFVPAGEVIPNDETHRHFGLGQTEAELTLEPGEHVLRLQFADGTHIALEGDQYRDEITVNVEEGTAEATTEAEATEAS